MIWTKRSLARGCAALLIGALGVGCSGEKQPDEECVDPPKKAVKQDAPKTKLERFGLGRAGDENKDQKNWCRACVMSKVGYASCQKVYADQPDEPRDALKARARAKACQDAKFPTDACPDGAVISLLCKGDPPPAGTPDPGTALQNLHQALSSGKPLTPTGTAAPDGAEPATEPATAADAKPADQPEPPAEPATKPSAKQ